MTNPSPAQALWNQRANLAAKASHLRTLINAVGRPTDLSHFQWVEILAYAQEYQPDLIIELGRGLGNSTCCFLEAARYLRPVKQCKVVSLCLSDSWFTWTLPRLQKICPADWLAPAHIHVGDILQYDFAPILEGARRCLVFWDAHGFEIAECVLGNLLPKLADRPHVVLMHDLSDLRYAGRPREYGEQGLWKGVNAGETSLWLGHIFSRVGQAVSIVDFTNRNNVPLHSADESLHTELGTEPAKVAELKRLLGDDLMSLQAHWFWFSLNEATGPVSFPRFTRPQQHELIQHGPPGGFIWRKMRGLARRVRRVLPGLQRN